MRVTLLIVGVLSLLAGGFFLLAFFGSRGIDAYIYVQLSGSGLLGGLLLIAFAYVIDLLEQIAKNTRPAAPASSFGTGAAYGVAPHRAADTHAKLVEQTTRLPLGQRPAGTDPVEGLPASPVDVNGEYRGNAYSLHKDYSVSAINEGRCLTWGSLADFRRWVDAQSKPEHHSL